MAPPVISWFITPSKYKDKYHTPTCYEIVIGTNLTNRGPILYTVCKVLYIYMGV